jgi:hypothetical protein
MRMPEGVDLGDTRIAYRLIDIRTVACEALIKGGRPGDLALALLAKGGSDRLAEIARRASELRGPERQRVLAQLVLLCGLRQLTGRLTMELKTMGATIGIAKNEILRDLVRDGQTSIVRGQLEAKFGKLPKWVDERMANPKLSDVERWSKRLLTAETLEAVLGKR